MAIKGDFISFTYNGVHSTELGIVRVSSSNRYNDQLIPTSKEKTSESIGMNGTYFFKTYYTSREIILNIAFDEVAEDKIRLMRQIFGDQKEHQLIFDDEPYKVYYAKEDAYKFKLSGKTDKNYFTVKELDGNYRYKFKVVAVNKDNLSLDSGVVKYYTVPKKTPAPAISSVSAKNVKISWQKENMQRMGMKYLIFWQYLFGFLHLCFLIHSELQLFPFLFLLGHLNIFAIV